jgi:hypothetical protein
VGGLLSLVEWRTRARYALEPLSLALLLVVFFGGLGLSGIAIEQTLRGAKETLATNPEHAGSVVIIGCFEAVGGFAINCATAAVQAILWGLARHGTSRARRGKAGRLA